MASLEQRNGRYRVVFRHGGEKFQRSLGTKSRREANAAVTRLEENIRLVLAGRLTIPPDADVPMSCFPMASWISRHKFARMILPPKPSPAPK